MHGHLQSARKYVYPYFVQTQTDPISAEELLSLSVLTRLDFLGHEV